MEEDDNNGGQAVLAGTMNDYGGVCVGPDGLPEPAPAFAAALEASLAVWTAGRVKVAWLRIPARRADLIAVAVAAGFAFHHCYPEELTLTRRLLPEAGFPLFATHSIGVGAVVLSERQEVLTVIERDDVRRRPGYFKLPGGMLDRAEHFEDGVRREVFEETGIRTEFCGLLALRHHHQGQFGTSNLYVVCSLRPLSSEIVMDPGEIGVACWMPVREYLDCATVGAFNKGVVRAALAGAALRSVKLDGYMNGPHEYEIFLPDQPDRQNRQDKVPR